MVRVVVDCSSSMESIEWRDSEITLASMDLAKSMVDIIPYTSLFAFNYYVKRVKSSDDLYPYGPTALNTVFSDYIKDDVIVLTDGYNNCGTFVNPNIKCNLHVVAIGKACDFDYLAKKCDQFGGKLYHVSSPTKLGECTGCIMYNLLHKPIRQIHVEATNKYEEYAVKHKYPYDFDKCRDMFVDKNFIFKYVYDFRRTINKKYYDPNTCLISAPMIM